jgi:hypothetical protein
MIFSVALLVVALAHSAFGTHASAPRSPCATQNGRKINDFFSLFFAGQNCEARTTCAACFSESNCGWCVTSGTCKGGDALGPALPDKCPGVSRKNTLAERQLWYFSKSQVISSESGFPVTPVTTSVYLKPGEDVVVIVSVTAPLPTDQDLDLMFVQDTSGSMADDIQVFRTLATSLVNSVLKLSKTAWTGLASFIEKPIAPQGFGPLDDKYLLADGSVRNYVYRLETPLASSSLALQRALFKLDATSNRDLPEASFEAIGQVLTCPNIGWRKEARKVVIVTTDAKYHTDVDPIAPDWYISGAKDLPPWDGRCYAPLAGTKYTREKNNYPSKLQIANLFKSQNIIPIFAIAHNREDDSPVLEIDYWRQYQQQFLGFGAVVQLSDNSDNLIDLIVTALTNFNQIVTLTKTTDTQNAVKGIVTTASNAQPPQYTGVKPGTTVDFRVTLGSSQRVQASDIILQSPGFGTATIKITSDFPCNDCKGVAGGTDKWDKCQECAGNNACVGCDGVPFSGKVMDKCNVCGGANLCETDCKASGMTPDKCGVCGGTNLCVGCDGVPNSLAQTDLCGVCGGQNACIGCDGLKDGKKLDLCGVCGGTNACVGCDDVAYTGSEPKKVYDICGVCGGKNACFCDASDRSKSLDLCGYCGVPGDKFWNVCVGCDGLVGTGLVYDLCGVCGGANECVSDCDTKPFGQRRDVCGECGGNGTTCLNFDGVVGRPNRKAALDTPAAAIGEGSIIGIAVGIPLALLLCGALVAAFFIYKQRTNPYWSVPDSLLNSGADGLAENPLYSSEGGWKSNAIAQ